MFNTPRKGPSLPFNFPYIAGATYAPGYQPNSPGESCIPYGSAVGSVFNLIPWPNGVPSLNVLSSFAGMPRDYPLGIVNNAVSTFPNNFLYFGGFAGKSKG